MQTTYLNLTQNITALPGLSPLSPHAASGEEGSIHQMATDEASLISACSVLALNLAPEFNLIMVYMKVAVAKLDPG